MAGQGLGHEWKIGTLWVFIGWTLIVCVNTHVTTGEISNGTIDDMAQVITVGYNAAFDNPELPIHAIEVCTWDGSGRKCHWQTNPQGMRFPPEYCSQMTDCSGCIIGWETRLVLIGGDLVKPTEVRFEQHLDKTGLSGINLCHGPGGHECYCSKERPCSGDARYCAAVPCDLANQCNCSIANATTHVWTRYEVGEAVNVPFISFQVCLYNISAPPPPEGNPLAAIGGNQVGTRRRGRSLRSVNEAEARTPTGTIRFRSPIITFQSAGTVILQKNGMEHVEKTGPEGPFQITVPGEYLLNSGTISVTLVRGNGLVTEAEFEITGQPFCTRLTCFICLEVIYFRHCLPPHLIYSTYIIIFIVVSIVVWYLKFLFCTCCQGCRLLISIIYMIHLIIRYGFRGSLILGYIVGERLRTLARDAHVRVQRAARELREARVRAPAVGETLLIITLLLSIMCNTITAQCTAHQMMTSAVQECTEDLEGTTCKVNQQVQITLQNLKYSLCLWFLDANNNEMFEMKVEFREVGCLWQSTLQYYTFPTELRVISQISCPQNLHCNWLLGCKPGYVFPALTREAKSYSGILNCIAGSHNAGCHLIHRDPCLHYKAYLVPDHARTYSVHKIRGAHCAPELEITLMKNGTRESHTIKRQGFYAGITVTPLGTLDQSIDLVDRNLIMRIADFNEAYIETAASPNRPKFGEIGDVQSDVIYSNQFSFDANQITCNDLEERLRCEKIGSYLEKMTQDQAHRLPLAFSNHRFFIGPDKLLRSTLIQSAPVVVHLGFSNYKIKLQHRMVCPHIEKITPPTGCYSCQTMAEMIIEAKSTCLEGEVGVEFLDISISTRSLLLKTSTSSHTISFFTDKQCTTERLCLVSRSAKSCESITFCLETPVLDVSMAKNQITVSEGSYAPGNWPSLGSFFSIFSSTGNFLWWAAIAGGAAIMITFGISMCITLCRR